jgi:uncharacterized repeat protein (TIGR01451 family)
VLASASATYVGRVTYDVNPFNPEPNSPFTVTATFHGAGSGQPCDISNIRATIQGVPVSGRPGSGYTHPPNRPTLTATFRFSGFASGDLTPSISYDTKQRNKQQACAGGSGAPVTPEGNKGSPSVTDARVPALGIAKALSGNTSDFVSGEIVTYKITVTNSGDGDAFDLTVSDQLSPHLLFVAAPGASSTPAVGSTGVVSWTPTTLLARQSLEYSLRVRVADDGYAGDVLNHATVVGGSEERTSRDVKITVHRDPDVRIRKTINGPSETGVRLPAGSIATYQIHYENVGSGDASNVVITDTLPAEIIGTPTLQGGDSHSWEPSGRVATWNINQLDAGAASVVTVSGQIDPSLGDVAFDNQAVITWTGGSKDSNVANIAVNPEPDLDLTKKGDQDNASPGDRVHISLTYENKGGAAAVDSTVIDFLPEAVSPVAGSYGSATYSGVDHTLTWSLGRIEPGERGSLSYAVDVNADASPGRAVNIATLTATNLPAPLQAVAQTVINVDGVVDLVAHKVLQHPDRDHVNDGTDVTYQIWVENRGNLATSNGVVLSDVLSPHLTYSNTSQGWTLSGDQTTLSRTIADIPAGGRSGTYLLTLQVDGTGVPDGATIDNQVEVTNTTNGVDNNHVSAPARVFYNLPAKVTLTKTASPATSVPVFPGDVIDYTLTAHLETLQGVDDLQVGDVLPLGLTFEGSVDPGYTVETLDDGRQFVRWPVTSLQSGERQYHLRARVAAGLPLGTALENTGGAAFNNEFAVSTVTHHTTEAAVSLAKTRPDTQAQIVVGEPLRYEITYTNTGKVPLTGVTVTDNLPANTTLADANPSPSSTTNSGATLEWVLPDLDPGNSSAITLTVNTTGTQVGETLTNQVSIATAEALPQSASVVSTVRQAPQLQVEKTASPTVAYPGDTVTFTLHYQNVGKGDALNTVLADLLPIELDFVSATNQQTADANGVVEWALGTLKAGASGSKIVTMRVPATGQFVPALQVDNFVTLVSDNDADSDAATVTLTENPAFSISKHEGALAPDAVGTAAPGDTLHYVIDLGKSGGAASGVLVADLLPDHTSYVAGSANYPIDSALSDVSAGLLVWNIGTLGEGVINGQITFDAVIDAVVTNGTRLVNRAGLSSTETGGLLSNEVTTVVTSAPVFSLAKSASKQTLFSPTTVSGAAADSVTYYLTVENIGDADATNVTVSDLLPSQLTIDPSSTVGTVSGQNIRWSVPTLEVGVPLTFAVTATVDKDLLEGTLLVNKANLTTTMPGVGGATSNEVKVLVTGEPVLSVTKSASAKSVSPGEEFSYTITYQNAGTKAVDTLRIEDTLPDYVTFVSATQGGAPDAQQTGTIVWNNLPALPPGASDSVQVVVQVDAVVPNGALLPNTATLAPTTDPDQSVTSEFTGKPPVVSSGPVLELTKWSDTGDTVIAGDLVIFSLEVANIGSDTANNLTLVDTLPPGLTLVDASGNYSTQGNAITWTANTLPAKQVAVLQVTAQADSTLDNGYSLINRASLTATELPLPLTDEAEVFVRNAVLTLAKSGDRSFANSGISATSQPGDEVVYQLDYENTGSVEAVSAQIVDVLPPEVTFIESLPAPDTINGRTLGWDLGSVPAGGNGSVLIKTQVGDDLREGTIIHNSASITSSTTGASQSNDWDVTVLSSAVLTVEKATSVATIGAGDSITYDITVRNEGSDDAVNIEVVDTLSSAVTFVSATGGGTHSGEAAGGTVTWALSNLAPGDQAVYHVTLQAAAALLDGDAVLNTVTASGEKPDNGGPLPQTTDSLTIPVTGQPALELDYEVNRKTVPAGLRLVYTITTHNIGNADAINAVLTATIPDGATPARIDTGGRFENGRAVWSTASLPPSGPIILSFAVDTSPDLPARTQLNSKANITAENAAPKSGSALTLVVGEPDLEVRKQGPRLIAEGEDIEYRITVSNVGTQVATDVVLVDQLPDAAFFKSADPAPNTVMGQTLRWDLGALPTGSIRPIELVLSNAPDGDLESFINLVSVSDRLREVEVDQWQTQERATGVLSVTIVPDQPMHAPGSSVVYHVDWRNAGSIATAGTVVKAAVPSGATYDSATDGGQLHNGWVEWQVGDLPVAAAGQATFTVDIEPTLASGTRLDSVAEIRADSVAPDSDNAVVNVVGVPILLLAKSVSRSAATVGDNVTFTVSYRNSGNAPLTGVTVIDTLPAGLEATAASGGGTISADGATVAWNLTDIAAGAEGALTVDVTLRQVFANESINSVTLRSNELPDETATATLSTANPVQPVPIDGRWLWLLAMLMGALVLVRGRYRLGH